MQSKRRTRALRLLAGSLAALGGCGWGAVPMYGIEVPTFTFQGHVVDAETGEPIQGIQVRFGGDQQLTDADGAWELTGSAPADCETGYCHVQAEDIDGDDNGVYLSDEVELLGEDRLAENATDVIIELEPVADTGL